jgi:hypothetical protein
MKNEDRQSQPSRDSDSFRELAARLVRVPKDEADKQEAVYRRERKKKPK